MPLKNNYSEDLELASLLIKIDVFPAKVTAAEWAGPNNRALCSRVSRELSHRPRGAEETSTSVHFSLLSRRTVTSVPSVVHLYGNGLQKPPASCSMPGPGKGPLKLDTSSHLKTSASPRSILQTISTVGNEGEGGEGEAGQCGTFGGRAPEPERIALLGQSFGSFLLCEKAIIMCLWVVLSGYKASKDISLLFRAPRRTRVNGDNRL